MDPSHMIRAIHEAYETPRAFTDRTYLFETGTVATPHGFIVTTYSVEAIDCDGDLVPGVLVHTQSNKYGTRELKLYNHASEHDLMPILSGKAEVDALNRSERVRQARGHGINE